MESDLSNRPGSGDRGTFRAAVVLGLGLVVGCGPAMDQSEHDRDSRIRRYLDALVQGGKTPGIQYLAVDATGPVFAHAAGFADVGNRVPMTGDTTMMAYSMGKTITAVAVLRLVGAGKIGLDDAADRWVQHPYGAAVTVRHLLAHTSGIPNPQEPAEAARVSDWLRRQEDVERDGPRAPALTNATAPTTTAAPAMLATSKRSPANIPPNAKAITGFT
jgi:CubicO group peptidase (beta-lactamase class C family)